MKFDGCKVKETVFEKLGVFDRFFTDNGDGFSKQSQSSCVDDYSLRPIKISPGTVVWIKDKA